MVNLEGHPCADYWPKIFDNIQRIKGQVKRYPDGWSEVHPLAGLMYCIDCIGKMYVHKINNGKHVPMYAEIMQNS